MQALATPFALFLNLNIFWHYQCLQKRLLEPLQYQSFEMSGVILDRTAIFCPSFCGRGHKPGAIQHLKASGFRGKSDFHRHLVSNIENAHSPKTIHPTA